ncbi:MAG: GAF domain-containing protein [Gemmatimonadetes bacterium]|nr:GAF domain-containing protein [Gemmatimonadota bacterium]
MEGTVQVQGDSVRVNVQLLDPETDAMLMAGRGIVGHVIATGEAVRVPDVRLDPRYVAGRAAPRSEVAVPQPGPAETLGALDLESDRVDAFDEQALELLHLFADAAGAAIGRAMLHRELMERRRIEDQLRLAQEVQSRLLPGAPPRLAGWDVAGCAAPAPHQHHPQVHDVGARGARDQEIAHSPEEPIGVVLPQ